MNQNTQPTIRQEIAARLRVHYRVYGKRPESYNAKLGMGRISKQQDRLYFGYSIITERIHY